MCSQQTLDMIVRELVRQVRAMFGERFCEAILFGSYARQDADEESDIDVMLLLNVPRDELPKYRRAVAQVAGALLCEHGVLVSPIMENQSFFERNRYTYPLYRNIDKEGVRYAA